MPDRLPRLTAWFLMPLLSLVAGCTSSTDFHRFESTHDMPMSVSLVESLGGETLWHIDVPPEHELRLQLVRGMEGDLIPTTTRPATQFEWSLYETSDAWAERVRRGRVAGDRRLPLPGRPVRINVTYHKPGAFPHDAFLPERDRPVPPRVNDNDENARE